MLWKIFSGVWLYGWKCYFPTNFSHGNSTHGSKLRQSKATTTKTPPPHHHNNNKNQNHTENTFSHLPNKYIISSLNSETQIKPRKKKNHNPVKLREEGREGGRSVLGSRTIGFGVRRSRSGTTNLGSRSGMKNQCCDCDRDRREGEVEGWSRTAKLKGEVERRSRRVRFEVERRSRTALRSGFDLFLGAISLAGAWLAGGVCSLPLSSSSISLSLSSLSFYFLENCIWR